MCSYTPAIFVVVALFLASDMISGTDALPTCPPPSGPGNITFVPNPNNCSNYYECDNGILHNLNCPRGLYFCSKKEACTWSWDCEFDDCKIVRAAPAKHETPERDVHATVTCPPPSELGNVTFFPNPNNCSNYYECDNGSLKNLDCPKGLFFCSNKTVCTWKWDCSFDDCRIVRDEKTEDQKPSKSASRRTLH